MRAAVDDMQWSILRQKVSIELLDSVFCKLNLRYRKWHVLIDILLSFKSSTWIIIPLQELEKWVHISCRLKVMICLSIQEIKIILLVVKDKNHVDKTYCNDHHRDSDQILRNANHYLFKWAPEAFLLFFFGTWSLFNLMLLTQHFYSK